MSISRRQDDRRRRLMITSASASLANPTAASRSRMEELREARRPAVAYGSRVRHCLRGRWFSLVPVERKPLVKLFSLLAAMVVSLILANDATVRFAEIANRPPFVGVFQVIQPGSLGRYFISLMYLAIAGAAWMVYQLRRFRNDDFSGNYRLWQWVVGVSLASSVATVVPILAMLGGGIEWLMGKRIALSGQDWISLFLIVGGAILALRSVAEMWRYRGWMILMVIGWACTAVPIAVDWNLLSTHTILRWSVVTSAPIVAVVFWFAATTGYLRSLYREVRGIEPAAGYLQRFRQTLQERQFEKAAQAEARAAAKAAARADADAKQRAAAERRAAAKLVATENTKTANATQTPANRNSANRNPANRNPVAARGESEQDDDDQPQTKRRWFGLRGPAKRTAAAADKDDKADKADKADKQNDRGGSRENDVENVVAIASPNEDPPKQTKERRRWWPRRKPKPAPSDSDQNESSQEDSDHNMKSRRVPDVSNDSRRGNKPDADNADSDPTDPTPQKRRFGLGSIMNRKAKPAEAETADNEAPARGTARHDDLRDNHRDDHPDDEYSGEDDSDDGEEMADDDVDWSSLNKAERRKMRKQLKRSGRAA